MTRESTGQLVASYSLVRLTVLFNDIHNSHYIVA
jgi:hypothetical protein